MIMNAVLAIALVFLKKAISIKTINMKKLMIASLGMMLAMNMNAAKKPKTNALQFNPESGVKASLTMPDGKVVNYTAYNKLYFVTNVEDSTYQYMNIFVPEGANEQTPIFLHTYVGGLYGKSGR